MNSGLADPSLEGDLSKYTNVIKGYQKRYFAIDSEKGVLNYFQVNCILVCLEISFDSIKIFLIVWQSEA